MTREWQEAANEAGKEANLNPIVRVLLCWVLSLQGIDHHQQVFTQYADNIPSFTANSLIAALFYLIHSLVCLA